MKGGGGERGIKCVCTMGLFFSLRREWVLLIFDLIFFIEPEYNFNSYLF